MKVSEDIQRQIDARLAEYNREFEMQHTAWIVLRNGCTYVGYDIKDYLTEKLMTTLRELINLMGIKYSIKYPFGEDETYYIMFDGEDKQRADFIQKFLSNGYQLTW